MKPEWKVKKIRDIATIVNGGTPDTTIKDFWNGDILWITPKDMGKLSSIYVYDTERRITEAGLKNSSAKIIPPNSIILSSRAPIGHLAINKVEISTNQGCKGIIPENEMLTKYLFYFLKNSIDLLNSLGSGTTFKELSSTKLNDVDVPFPPLPEQQRIVDILDQSFAAIDQAIENMEKNIALSNSIFENHLNNYFTFRQLNWIEKKLNKLGLVQTGSTPSTLNKYYFGEFIPFIKPGDVDVDGFGNLNYENEKLSEQGLKVSRRILNNSILMVCIGGSIGKVGITNRDITCNQQINSLTLREDYFPKFFYYAMRSYSFNKQVLNGASQATLPIINKSKWENLSISFPDNISEQKKISSELDDLLNQSQNLQNLYIQKINKLQELKQSILHKAFQGEL